MASAWGEGQAAVPLASTAPEVLPNGAELAPFIGTSRWHREIGHTIDRLAQTTDMVTIAGPQGSGKTLVARHIHWRSTRAHHPCQTINLRQFPVEMIESELFGYARGGLFQRHGHVPGLAAAAGEGICIIQGIEQLPATVQERMLPWFAGEAVQPVGGEAAERFPARIVVELRLPAFPKAKESPVITPLYELLRQTVCELKPLTHHREDILSIAHHYLQVYSEAWGIAPRPFGPEAQRLLQRAPWHENVRGLMAAVAAAVMTGVGERIEARHLPPWVAGNIVDATDLGLDGVALEELVERKLALFFQRLGRYDVHDLYETVMEKIERPLLRLVLERTGGNQLRAAQLLGINRNTLRHRLKILGLR